MLKLIINIYNMKGQITAAIIACTLLSVETDAKILSKKNLKKVEKATKKVITDPAVQSIVISAVASNPAVTAAVVVAKALTN